MPVFEARGDELRIATEFGGPIGAVWRSPLTLLDSATGGSCPRTGGTGGLIGRDLFMTAHHVADDFLKIPQNQRRGSWWVLFNYQESAAGRPCEVKAFEVLDVVQAGRRAVGAGVTVEDKFDFAVLRLNCDAVLGYPGDAFGFLRLRTFLGIEFRRLYAMGHPKSSPKVVTSGRLKDASFICGIAEMAARFAEGNGGFGIYQDVLFGGQCWEWGASVARGFSGAPVLDGEGFVRGIVTEEWDINDDTRPTIRQNVLDGLPDWLAAPVAEEIVDAAFAIVETFLTESAVVLPLMHAAIPGTLSDVLEEQSPSCSRVRPTLRLIEGARGEICFISDAHQLLELAGSYRNVTRIAEGAPSVGLDGVVAAERTGARTDFYFIDSAGELQVISGELGVYRWRPPAEVQRIGFPLLRTSGHSSYPVAGGRRVYAASTHP